MSRATTASPKPSFRVTWRVVDAVVGRGNAGRTTSKSGHPCPWQNCSQGPAAVKTRRGFLLNRPSCPRPPPRLPAPHPEDAIGQGTELNSVSLFVVLRISWRKTLPLSVCLSRSVFSISFSVCLTVSVLPPLLFCLCFCLSLPLSVSTCLSLFVVLRMKKRKTSPSLSLYVSFGLRLSSCLSVSLSLTCACLCLSPRLLICLPLSVCLSVCLIRGLPCFHGSVCIT